MQPSGYDWGPRRRIVREASSFAVYGAERGHRIIGTVSLGSNSAQY